MWVKLSWYACSNIVKSHVLHFSMKNRSIINHICLDRDSATTHTKGNKYSVLHWKMADEIHLKWCAQDWRWFAFGRAYDYWKDITRFLCESFVLPPPILHFSSKNPFPQRKRLSVRSFHSHALSWNTFTMILNKIFFFSFSRRFSIRYKETFYCRQGHQAFRTTHLHTSRAHGRIQRTHIPQTCNLF